MSNDCRVEEPCVAVRHGDLLEAHVRIGRSEMFEDRAAVNKSSTPWDCTTSYRVTRPL